MYEEYSKSVAGALVIELFLPSGGLFYTGRYGEAGLYWAATVTGVLLVVGGLPGPMDEGPSGVDRLGPGFWTGIGLIAFVRLGAMAYAPMAAHQHNEVLAYQLGLRQPHGDAGQLPQIRPRQRAGLLSGGGNAVVLPVFGLSF